MQNALNFESFRQDVIDGKATSFTLNGLELVSDNYTNFYREIYIYGFINNRKWYKCCKMTLGLISQDKFDLKNFLLNKANKAILKLESK